MKNQKSVIVNPNLEVLSLSNKYVVMFSELASLLHVFLKILIF